MATAIPGAPVAMETLGPMVTSSVMSPPEVSLTMIYPQQHPNSVTAANISATIPRGRHNFDMLWCNECGKSHVANCSTHGSLLKIRDREIPSKAKLTVPHMLSLKGLGLSSDGQNMYSVVAKKIVQKRTMFGPFDAPVIDTKPPEDPYNKQLVLKLFENDGSCVWLDQHSEDQCNWMIYVQAARYLEEINMVAYQYKDKLYFTTTKVIAPNQELKVWYGQDYREWMDVPDLPRLQEGSDDEFVGEGGVDTGIEEWNCSLCQLNFMTFEELEEHKCSAPRVSRSRANYRRKGRPVKRFHNKLISTRAAAKRKDRLTAAAVAAKKRKVLPKIQPTKVPKPVFECVYCSKALCGENAYKIHLSIHTGKKPFVCEYPDCSKGFTSKYKLERHALIHSDSKNFKCAFCDRSFNRKDHLKIHLAVHDQNRKPNICDICGKEYSSNVTFRTHMALHAAETGDRVCKICNKDFATKEDLIFHIRIHSGSRLAKMPSDKQQNCPHCDKKFFTKKDVKRHLIVHTKKKDFLCQFCPQRFGRKDHLSRHIKATHLAGVLKIEEEQSLKEDGRSGAKAKKKVQGPVDLPSVTTDESVLQTALTSPPITPTPVLLTPNTARLTAAQYQVPLTIPCPSPAPISHSVPPTVLDPATVIAAGQPLRHLVYATGQAPGAPPPPILHPVAPTAVPPQPLSMPTNNLPQPLASQVNQIRTLPPNTDLQHGFNQRLNTLYNNKFCNPPQSIEAMVGYIETLKFLENLPTVGPPPHGHPMTNPSPASYTSGYLVPPEVHLARPPTAFPQPPGMVPTQISQPSHLTVVAQPTVHSSLPEQSAAMALSQPSHVSPHLPHLQPAPSQPSHQYR